MTSRLNVFRHGQLEDARAIMDGDVPIDEYEVRALLFKAIDEIYYLRERVTDLELAAGIKQAEAEGEFNE